MSLKNYKEYSDISARLGEAIRKDRLSHAYIIEGDNLSQKEEYAIDIAKAVLCKAEPGIGCDQCIICRKIEHGNYQTLQQIADMIQEKFHIKTSIMAVSRLLKKTKSAS